MYKNQQQSHALPYKASLTQVINPTFEHAMIQEAAITEAIIQLYPTEPKALHEPDLHFRLTNSASPSKSYNCCYPLMYQRKKIGQLQLTQATLSKSQQQKAQQHVKDIAKRLPLLIKRYQASSLSHHYLHKDLFLSGYSDALMELDSFIERAASTTYPVIIEGAIGCEKLSVASAIHYNSNLKHSPFIEINCSTPSTEEFQQALLRCFEQAQGGCIFLNGIDTLSPPQQNILAELLSASTLPGVSGHRVESITNVRLLASTTQPLGALVANNSFARELYEYFNFLHVQLPALASRKEDIPHIINNLLEKYSLFNEQCFDEQAIQALCNYHWPENNAELERVVARLLTLATSNPINVSDIELQALPVPPQM